MTTKAMPNSFSGAVSNDPLDIEITPGFRVRDIQTANECAGIILRLEAERSSIVSQLSRHADDPAGLPGWRGRANGAIKWKKKAIEAVKLHREALIIRETVSEPKIMVPAETVDPMDAVVNGFTVSVRHLQDLEAVDAAILTVESERNAILAQFPRQERNPLLFGKGWRTKAQAALSWKKRVMKALMQRKKAITEGSPVSVSRKESRRAALLDVIHDDIGDERMEIYIARTKALRPELFTPVDIGDK